MIVSLISSVLGMVGGLLPDIFTEVRETREHAREIERLDKQAELQLRLLEARTDAKLAEIEGNAHAEEMRAFREQMKAIYGQQQPTGIRFVDGFNALIRPTTAALIMLMFVVTAGLFILGVTAKMTAGAVTPEQAAAAIWGSLVGDAIQAVLGFLFGYRSTRNPATRARK
jgi:ABC-type nickel/cobalt efflux system permease component RcnA